MRAATINMVAEYAGVSRGTVDRVLNQRPHVKPELYERIVHAMKVLGYVPPKEDQAMALGLPIHNIRPFKLGVLLAYETGYLKDEVMMGIEKAKKVFQNIPVEIIVEQCETSTEKEILERIDALIETGISGIAMRSIDTPAIAQKIEVLNQKKIPAVTFNSDISDCRRICFIGQDLIRSGRIAGELMAKYVRKNEHILAAIGDPEFHAHRQRLQGFCERMHEKGFLSSQFTFIETHNDYQTTYEKVLDVINCNPDVRGIYMANHSVKGCADAVRDAGKAGEFFTISHDLTKSTRALLKNREIDFVISQNILDQSYESLVILMDYIQKKQEPKKQIIQSKMEIFCAENLTEE